MGQQSEDRHGDMGISSGVDPGFRKGVRELDIIYVGLMVDARSFLGPFEIYIYGMGMVGGGKLRTRGPGISTNVPHIQGRIQDFGKGGGVVKY